MRIGAKAYLKWKNATYVKYLGQTSADTVMDQERNKIVKLSIP